MKKRVFPCPFLEGGFPCSVNRVPSPRPPRPARSPRRAASRSSPWKSGSPRTAPSTTPTTATTTASTSERSDRGGAPAPPRCVLAWGPRRESAHVRTGPPAAGPPARTADPAARQGRAVCRQGPGHGRVLSARRRRALPADAARRDAGSRGRVHGVRAAVRPAAERGRAGRVPRARAGARICANGGRGTRGCHPPPACAHAEPPVLAQESLRPRPAVELAGTPDRVLLDARLSGLLGGVH